MAMRDVLEFYARDPEGRHLYTWLLEEALFSDKSRSVGGINTPLKKGQVVFGYREWETKTGLTTAVMRRVLGQMEKNGYISKQKHPKCTVISMTSLMVSHQIDKQSASSQQAASTITKKEEGKQKKQDPTDKDLSAHPAQTAPKAKPVPLDWSPLNLTPEHLEAVKAIRAKHGAKGKISQLVINTLGKEFAKCRAAGLGDAEIIGEWDMRGWVALKADWLLKNDNRGRGGYSKPPSNLELMREAGAAVLYGPGSTFDPDQPFG